jgi:phosphotransferase system HPr (HPr) family protein
MNHDAETRGPSTNGECLKRTVVITNPHGFHMRPATAFAQRANQFKSTVTLSRSGQRVNGKSPLELLFLAAEQGTEVELDVDGEDARAAIEVLAELLAAPTVGDIPDPECADRSE